MRNTKRFTRNHSEKMLPNPVFWFGADTSLYIQNACQCSDSLHGGVFVDRKACFPKILQKARAAQ